MRIEEQRHNISWLAAGADDNKLACVNALKTIPLSPPATELLLHSLPATDQAIIVRCRVASPIS